MPSPDYLPGAKFGIRAFAGDTNISDLDAASQAMRDDIEAKMLGYGEGTHAARPAAGISNRIYRETDTGLYFFDTGAAWVQLPVAAADGKLRGAANIAASESRTNTAYGLLTTPDQVTGIVLPTNGLIRVSYQATWQESVAGAARAAIFVGSNQLTIAASDGASASDAQFQAAATNNASANVAAPLATTANGLFSVNVGSGGYLGDVTTGQVVGLSPYGGNLVQELGGAIRTPVGIGGGACEITAAAGTYTVSVQFKASSGSVTASNRKLWVETIPF